MKSERRPVGTTEIHAVCGLAALRYSSVLDECVEMDGDCHSAQAAPFTSCACVLNVLASVSYASVPLVRLAL